MHLETPCQDRTLFDAIQRAKFVCFDVFDTVLERTVPTPADVFHVVARQLDSLGVAFPGNFHEARMRAEYDCRAKQHARGISEVTLSEIYAELGRTHRLPSSTLRTMEECEIDVERRVLTPRERGLQLYRECIRLGKPILFVSDTYFSLSFMQTALRENGFEIGDVLASSAVRRTKRSGELYRDVIAYGEKIGFEPRDILFIGDNKFSDVRVALTHGLNAAHLPNQRDSFSRVFDIDMSIAAQVRAGTVLSPVLRAIDSFESATATRKAGFFGLGPLLVGFAGWLSARSRAQEVDILLFCSRDGFIIKETYNSLGLGEGTYFHISRAVLYRTLFCIDRTAAARLFLQNYSDLTLREFIARLGMEPERVVAKLGVRDTALVGKLRDLRTQGVAETILERFGDELEASFRPTYECFADLVRQLGIGRNTAIGFVDLGWHGSLQAVFRRVLDEVGYHRCTVHGFYLALFEHGTRPSSRDTAEGYLSSFGSNRELELGLRSSPSLVEVLHSAPHGSVVDYVRVGEDISPLYEDNAGEAKQWLLVDSIQSEARNFIEQAKKSVEGSLVDFKTLSEEDFPPSVFAGPLLRMMKNPEPEVAELGTMLFLAPDFGVTRNRRLIDDDLWPAATVATYATRLALPASVVAERMRNFSEERYLQKYPDVAEAVARGRMSSGRFHFLEFGLKEGRAS